MFVLMQQSGLMFLLMQQSRGYVHTHATIRAYVRTHATIQRLYSYSCNNQGLCSYSCNNQDIFPLLYLYPYWSHTQDNKRIVSNKLDCYLPNWIYLSSAWPKLNTEIGLHTTTTHHPPHKLLGQFQGTYEVEIRGIGLVQAQKKIHQSPTVKVP